MLAPDDFAAFFEEIHRVEPFPWQRRLLGHILDHGGRWPSTLDLPTGSGKTAAMDIALFHLALEADRGESRRAPARIAFVVDRRLVVDDAFERARVLARALRTPPPGSMSARVAQQLGLLAETRDRPLAAARLRGGIPREDDWARTPSQPTILCSTVDQVGSRLLFRGYGITDTMKPVHAGLLGSDCLILLDEAHLAEPFRQTLEWIGRYRAQEWRETSYTAPWGTSLLTATPGRDMRDAFSLSDDDRVHPVLSRRLNAAKPARLLRVSRPRSGAGTPVDGDGERVGSDSNDLESRTTAMVNEVRSALTHFGNVEHGVRLPAIALVVNRVARARAVFARVRQEFEREISAGDIAEPILMIGPARPVDRDDLVSSLAPLRTPERARGTLEKPLVIVATQCIEAGVDIDLDALVTELAPLDALRQRFGRLNRGGREMVPYASIVAMKTDLAARHDDPVYGGSLKRAWEALDAARQEGDDAVVDFGIAGFVVRMEPDALTEKVDAPILLPAHLDLLSQTSPVPAADPDASLYLHGPRRQPDTIAMVWRADIDPVKQSDDDCVRQLLVLVPPRPAEAIELPIWTVRRWLGGVRNAGPLADVAAAEPDDVSATVQRGRKRVFRWAGDDDRSRWIPPRDLRPGDTVVVPAVYGGVDRFGWNPSYGATTVMGDGSTGQRVTDVARAAAVPFSGRYFAVRVAPGLLEDIGEASLAERLAGAVSHHSRDVRDALSFLPLPQPIRDDLDSLDRARGGRVDSYLELYGTDEGGAPRGVVFVAPQGLEAAVVQDVAAPTTTEDDAAGSLPGFSLGLRQHNGDVEQAARSFAIRAGLPEARVRDIACAGGLHDAGKCDSRFQSWLYHGDPLGPDEANVLAKSNRRLPAAARAISGLPPHWRHEALSVRLAIRDARLDDAADPELVLWLVGVHHGYGRPLFPHGDPEESAPDVGPQSLAFDWRGADWPALFLRLKARYGIWELARMEAIVRLADHRASETRAAGNTP